MKQKKDKRNRHKHPRGRQNTSAAAQRRTTLSLRDRWRKVFLARYPVLRYLLVVAGLMSLFYVCSSTDLYRDLIFNNLLNFNAALSGAFIGLIHDGTVVSGNLIRAPEFTLTIARGCDGVEPMVLFGSAVLAYPWGGRRKLPGLALGILALFLLNQIRIVVLFFVGVYSRANFEFMHVEFWQFVFIMAALGLWILWMARVQSENKLTVKQA